jgi:large subunit ribosomal protein L24
MKIKKGDNVKIITGKDKGKKGKVSRVLVAKDKVIIEGINMMKKHQRPRKQGEQGSVLSIAMPMHVSNVTKLK